MSVHSERVNAEMKIRAKKRKTKWNWKSRALAIVGVALLLTSALVGLMEVV